MEKIEQIVGEVQDLRKLMNDFEGYKKSVEEVVSEMGQTVEFLGNKVKELDGREVDTEKIDEQFNDVRAKMEGMEGELRQIIDKQMGEKIDNLGKAVAEISNSLNTLLTTQENLENKLSENEAQTTEALAFKRSLQVFIKSLLGGK